MKQESSPDCLAFQVAHTTISPNYPERSSRPQIARSWLFLRMRHH
jgi:hypothetical protein